MQKRKRIREKETTDRNVKAMNDDVHFGSLRLSRAQQNEQNC